MQVLTTNQLTSECECTYNDISCSGQDSRCLFARDGIASGHGSYDGTR